MRSDEERLSDIVVAARDAARIVVLGHQRFATDPLLIRAAKNIVSEIGEAAKGIDDAVLASIDGLPWRAIKGMRDKVVHDYPEVDIDLLWDTLAHGIPPLGAAVARYLTAR